MEETSVRVAVRIRPVNQKEKLERCSECCKPLSKQELVMMGKDRQFTFDNVFGTDSEQSDIYNDCVSQLVENFMAGYNATILAYGQTGSGKTYTMGSSSECLMNEESKLGIIPRAMEQVFDLIAVRKVEMPTAEFYLRVQFLELYGEDINDLLDHANVGKTVSIRESEKGDTGIQIMGASEETVTSSEDMLNALERGTMCRTTGSTQMNSHSSRSHAIFTIILEQHLPIENDENEESSPKDGNITSKEDTSSSSGEGKSAEKDKPNNSADSKLEYRTAKFHFVDLAGSERAKRTGAVGTRLREGININKGLLALGNVISALGDENKRSQKSLHVPYRDSKLTRMLQDSLGGNSRTLMITCVSPADINYEETLNALRYANRARNIKNKPVVNRDPASSQIAFLKEQVAKLKMQLMNGGISPQLDGFVDLNHLGIRSDFSMSTLEHELFTVKERAKHAEDEVQLLQDKLKKDKVAGSELQEKYILTMAELDYYKRKYDVDNQTTTGPVEEGSSKDTVETSPESSLPLSKVDEIKLNASYLSKIETLQKQLEESDFHLTQARRKLDQHHDSSVSHRMHRTGGNRKRIVSGTTSSTTTGNRSSNNNSGSSSLFTVDEMSSEEISSSSELPDEMIDSILASVEKDNVEMEEDDDEKTKELKQKYLESQEFLRKSLKSHDVQLRNKQLLIARVQEERKCFEVMKQNFESKMAEMNKEVQETQAQWEELNSKLQLLEKAKSTESSQAAVTKLRKELKGKADRLKELEKNAKDLDLVKIQLRKKQKAEEKIQREIEEIKRQKVEYQRQMTEASKKYQKQAKEREREILQLKRQNRKEGAEKKSLAVKNERNLSILKMKNGQVAALQRRIREAQKFGRNSKNKYNKQRSAEEEKQRQLLDQWTVKRLERDEELERLTRALAKKDAAVTRHQNYAKELKRLQQAAEARAKKAEEATAQVQIQLAKQIEVHKQQVVEAYQGQEVDDDINVSPSPECRLEEGKVNLKTLWNTTTNSSGRDSPTTGILEVSVDNCGEDVDGAIAEMSMRIETAESEIDFQDKQIQDSIKMKYGTGNNEECEEEEEDEEDEVPFKCKTEEEAAATIKHISQAYFESQKRVKELSSEIEELREEHEKLKRNTSVRRSSFQIGSSSNNSGSINSGGGGASIGTMLSPSIGRNQRGSPTATGNSFSQQLALSSSHINSSSNNVDTHANNINESPHSTSCHSNGSDSLTINEKLRESHDLIQELNEENTKLKDYLLHRKGLKQHELDTLLKECELNKMENEIRNLQAATYYSSPSPRVMINKSRHSFHQPQQLNYRAHYHQHRGRRSTPNSKARIGEELVFFQNTTNHTRRRNSSSNSSSGGGGGKRVGGHTRRPQTPPLPPPSPLSSSQIHSQPYPTDGGTTTTIVTSSHPSGNQNTMMLTSSNTRDRAASTGSSASVLSCTTEEDKTYTGKSFSNNIATASSTTSNVKVLGVKKKEAVFQRLCNPDHYVGVQKFKFQKYLKSGNTTSKYGGGGKEGFHANHEDSEVSPTFELIAHDENGHSSTTMKEDTTINGHSHALHNTASSNKAARRSGKPPLQQTSRSTSGTHSSSSQGGSSSSTTTEVMGRTLYKREGDLYRRGGVSARVSSSKTNHPSSWQGQGGRSASPESVLLDSSHDQRKQKGKENEEGSSSSTHIFMNSNLAGEDHEEQQEKDEDVEPPRSIQDVFARLAVPKKQTALTMSMADERARRQQQYNNKQAS